MFTLAVAMMDVGPKTLTAEGKMLFLILVALFLLLCAGLIAAGDDGPHQTTL